MLGKMNRLQYRTIAGTREIVYRAFYPTTSISFHQLPSASKIAHNIILDLINVDALPWGIALRSGQKNEASIEASLKKVLL